MKTTPRTTVSTAKINSKRERPKGRLSQGRRNPIVAFCRLACGISLTALLTAASHSATFTVENTNDSGAGSLRQAILSANAVPGPDLITFNIPGPGVQTIIPVTQLPKITDAVTIDGYTQPGAKPNSLPIGTDAVLLIQIRWEHPASQSPDGLIISSSNCLVRGLVISDFAFSFAQSRAAIRILAPIGATLTGIRIEGCYFGTDASGLNTSRPVDGVNGNFANMCAIFIDAGNGPHRGYEQPKGIISGTTIGGATPEKRNVICGSLTGIWAANGGVKNTVIQGNYIGLPANGNGVGVSSMIGNWFGIRIDNGTDSVIGGAEPGARNVISNNRDGIYLYNGDAISTFASADGRHTVAGNFVGTDATGSFEELRNTFCNVRVSSSRNNVIGGSVPGSRNVIAANGGGGGVRLENNADGNVIQGNYFGTDKSGTIYVGKPPFAAEPFGVSVTNSSNNKIGGVEPGAGNLIAGLGRAINLHGDRPGIGGNVVEGNVIGVAADGSPLGCFHFGIVVHGSSGNRIGGTTAGAGNIIANCLSSSGNGVQIENASGNEIVGNRIYSNSGLGINLVPPGLVSYNRLVNLNDLGDADSGGNNLQNFPVIGSALTTAAETQITGTLNSTANSTFRIDFYSNTAADPSGHGEGEHWMGSAFVLTDAVGNASFAAGFTPAVEAGRFITATATDAEGNTSEFSATKAVVSTVIAKASGPASVNELTNVTLSSTGSSGPVGGTLSYSWQQIAGPAVNNLVGANSADLTFTAPSVELGGATLTFQLIVSSGAQTSAPAVVNVNVVNVNHTPVADAGADQSVAELSPVTLHGEGSFDIDDDAFSYEWVQISGPAVTLIGADTASPSFIAPEGGDTGAAGVVATLTFELRVDDGFPADLPAGGYTLENVTDAVTVTVTNVNNLPVARAGADQTIDEGSSVLLNGNESTDPDADSLAYTWSQIAGPAPKAGTLQANGSSLSFTAPAVDAGGADMIFELAVDDGYGGVSYDSVAIHVQNANDPPLASAAAPTVGVLWPPNHGMVSVGIIGVSDPDSDPVTIVITGVTQDEPTSGLGDGDTGPDAIINPDGTVLLRAERSGTGDGRVYRVSFTAHDGEASSSGWVKVVVPKSRKTDGAIDSGVLVNSTN